MSMVCVKTRTKGGGALYADDGNGNSGDFGYAGGVTYEYIDTDTLSDADYAEFRRLEKEDEEAAVEFLRGCPHSDSFETARYFPSCRAMLDP